jgi:hypothetical protein
MINFSTYQTIWHIIIGFLVFTSSYFALDKKNLKTGIVAGICTSVASFLWNWSIVFNNSTVYLNVDHPIFRISWADFFNGVCVYALVSFGLFSSLKADQYSKIKYICLVAFVITVFFDTFLF